MLSRVVHEKSFIFLGQGYPWGPKDAMLKVKPCSYEVAYSSLKAK